MAPTPRLYLCRLVRHVALFNWALSTGYTVIPCHHLTTRHLLTPNCFTHTDAQTQVCMQARMDTLTHTHAHTSRCITLKDILITCGSWGNQDIECCKGFRMLLRQNSLAEFVHILWWHFVIFLLVLDTSEGFFGCSGTKHFLEASQCSEPKSTPLRRWLVDRRDSSIKYLYFIQWETTRTPNILIRCKIVRLRSPR